jgi:hypothetical protein
MSPRTSQQRRVAVACLAALALAASTADAQTASPEIPSPFDTPAEPTPEAAPAPAPATVSATPASPAQPAPAPAPVESAPGPVVLEAPAPAPYVAARPNRGIRSLATGIALFAASLVPIGIAAGLSPNWDGCEWEGDTLGCGHTGAYLASMILFGFGSVIALGGVILIPIGAVALARSRYASAGERRTASISPFASPGRDGGAVFGISGLLPSF